MRTRTATLLQADVMALLDEAGSPKPTAADVLESLNQQWTKIYGALIQAGICWNMRTTNFTTAVGVDTYGTGVAFDATFWKTMGLDVQVSGTRWIPAHRFQFEQRNDYANNDWAWPERILYDIWGGTADAAGTDGTLLKLIPAPGGGYACRHFWFPAPQRLVNPGDVFDGVAGAERAIVFGTAQEMAIMLEQFEQADRWGALRSTEVAAVISLMRDRNVGEAPMARVVRGRPTLNRLRSGGGWGGRG